VSTLVERVRAIVEGLILAYGYVGIAVAIFVENVVPPIPAEFVLPFAGFLVSSGRLSFAGVLAAATLGSTLGTLAFYVAGRSLGEARVGRLVARHGRWILVREASYRSALETFRRHGDGAVFWARFVPGLRSIVSLPAGIARMPFGRFALLTLAGTATWNAVLILAGILLESRWDTVLLTLERLEATLWVVGGLALAAWLLHRRASARTAN
jgi:membrane protein DedA with SNARE-associated domain